MPTWNLGEKLYMDTGTADVTFKVGHKEIPGHRLILSEVCDYFKLLLEGYFKESKLEVVEIRIPARLFEEVIRFIYLGKLEISDWSIDNVLDLLSVAHEYQFHELFSELEQVLLRMPLNFDSWALVRSDATLYQSIPLQDKCASFVDEKLVDFVRFKHLELFSAEFVSIMFDTPGVTKCNQNRLFLGLLNWIKLNGTSGDITSALNKICWDQLCPKIRLNVSKESLSGLNQFDNETWNKLSESLCKCIVCIDSVLLVKDTHWMVNRKSESNLDIYFWMECLVFIFKSEVLVPIQIIEFESTKVFAIFQTLVKPLYGPADEMNSTVSIMADNDIFKYRVTITEAMVIQYMAFRGDFDDISVIKLTNIVLS